MKVDVIVFDLDDTLYSEIGFVKSGFLAVSRSLSDQHHIEADQIYKTMLKELDQNGRGAVFDNVLKKFNIYSKKLVKKCLTIYRTHKPLISLPEESIEILKYFEKTPLYIVTDGNKVVQNNKIEALGLRKLIKKDFITHRYGTKHAKPSTYCFEKIAKLEKTSYEKIVYIGDNPHKDFVNIKKLGFRTVRIAQGMFADVVKSKEFEAEINIECLSDLKKIIKR